MGVPDLNFVSGVLIVRGSFDMVVFGGQLFGFQLLLLGSLRNWYHERAIKHA